MKTFGSGFTTKLTAGTFNPVVFCEYSLVTYVSGATPNTGSQTTTVYRWSERGITYGGNSYEGRIVDITPLEEILDDSRQVFGEMGMRVANSPTNLVSTIQSGMKMVVYLGFEDSIGAGTVTDAEALFTGTVEGDIDITEDSVSFNLQDIAYSYDRQIPNQITDVLYPGAGREDIGMPIPIICGRTKDHFCRSIMGGFTTFLAKNISPTWSYTWIMTQDNERGKFKQTTDQLLSSTAGGDWYAYEYDTTLGLNATCSTSATGLVVTPVKGSYIERVFRTNTLTWDLPFTALHYSEILVAVSSWSAGYFYIDGDFVNHDNPKDNFGYHDFEGTKVRYALENDYYHTFTLKTNDAPAHSLDIVVSPDFDGTIELYRIAEWEQDSADNYIYVTDDVSHWYRGNVTTNGTTNASELSLPIVIEHTVYDVDTTYFAGLDRGAKVKASFNATAMEHITSGTSITFNPPSNSGEIVFIHDSQTIEGFVSGWASGFSVGDYVAIYNGKIADFENNPTTSVDEGGISTITDAEITNSLAKITAISGDVVTVDTYLYEDYPVVSESTELVTISCPFDCRITASYTDFTSDYSVGMYIKVSDTDYNDGLYTITDVVSDGMGGSYIEVIEQLTSEMYVPATLEGWSGLTTLALHDMFTYTTATYPLNLWKLTFDSPILNAFIAGDVVKLEDDSEEVFVIADHAVERISNVRINGIPFYNTETDESLVYRLSNTSYAKDGKTRAYLSIPSEEITNVVSRALQIDESNKSVLDDSYTDDTISVADPGHSHTSGGSATYNHELEIHWGIGFHFATEFGYDVKVISGSYNQVVGGFNNPISNPVNFTSSSSEVTVSFAATDSASVPWRYSTVAFKRTDNSTFEVVYDYKSGGASYSNFSHVAGYPAPTGGSVVGSSLADVTKSGDADSKGDNADTGYLYFSTPISVAQVRSNLKVTCDVVGNPDGTTGYKMPHHQIRDLINLYAQNPISGTEGDADIVEFVNESAMDTAFSKVWNTLDGSETATDIYPTMRELVQTNATGATNLSPNADLSNSLLSSSVEAIGEIDPKLYNEKGIHALDFAINSMNRLREVVGEMLLQSNMVLVWRNGIAYLKYLGDTPTADDTLTTGDVVMKTMSLSRSPISKLATDITVNFDYGNGGYNRNYHYVAQSWSSGTLTETQLDATRKYGSYKRDAQFNLPMVREHVAAEILAKRFYDEYGDVKFHAGFSSTLANLAVEPTDYITVPVPIHDNSVMDKGLVERKLTQFGSAVTKQADLINFEVRENHTTSGYYLSLTL